MSADSDTFEPIGAAIFRVAENLEKQQPTQEQKMEKARALRKNGVSYGRIVAATGLSMYMLKCELEPGFRAKSNAIVKESRGRRRKGQIHRTASTFPRYIGPVNHVATSVQTPAEVLADRDRRMAMTPRSLTAALLGDPPTPDWHKRP